MKIYGSVHMCVVLCQILCDNKIVNENIVGKYTEGYKIKNLSNFLILLFFFFFGIEYQ